MREASEPRSFFPQTGAAFRDPGAGWYGTPFSRLSERACYSRMAQGGTDRAAHRQGERKVGKAAMCIPSITTHDGIVEQVLYNNLGGVR